MKIFWMSTWLWNLRTFATFPENWAASNGNGDDCRCPRHVESWMAERKDLNHHHHQPFTSWFIYERFPIVTGDRDPHVAWIRWFLNIKCYLWCLNQLNSHVLLVHWLDHDFPMVSLSFGGPDSPWQLLTAPPWLPKDMLPPCRVNSLPPEEASRGTVPRARIGQWTHEKC